MAHVDEIRQEVYQEADDPKIYENLGIDVRFGTARLTGPHRVALDTGDGTERISARYIALCTGGRPAVPPIPGLDTVDYLTNESLFEIDDQPGSLIVLGGGPIGIEMAQAFQRLGTQVTVVDQADRILGRDDAEHAEILKSVLEKEGVQFALGASVGRVEKDGEHVAVHLSLGETTETLRADRILVATGRTPNIEGLGLGEAGVVFTKKGIQVDDKCRTSQEHIYAAGDCTGEYQLTHMSEHMAKVAMSNAVLKVPSKIDRMHVPWCTFADPEVAQLGATEAELKERGESYEVYRFPYSKVDRALAESEPTGNIKVFATKWRGKILGASIVGDRAGELVSLYAVAMKNGVTLREIADTIHPYPTYALGARRAADQWYVRKQFPAVIGAVQTIFGYRGPEPREIDPERIA